MRYNKSVVVLLLTCSGAIPALADNILNAADTSKVYDIDEVIVVNQPKESFKLRMQPVSSTSFGAEQLKSLNVQDLRQVSIFVPSFIMPEYGSRYTSSMYIRGIGSRINSPAVGIYVDNIPLLSKSAFNFHTYDIDRIDVLHGPQGTLYGMNTEGGLIRVYTKNPFQYQGTDLKLSLGSRFYRKAEVSHSRKLSDKTAFTLAAFYDGQNGFFKNQYDGKRADKMNEFGTRGRFMWQPTSRLSFDVIADYQYVRQNGFPYGMYLTKDDIAAAPITSSIYGRTPGTQQPNQNRQSNYRRSIINTGVGVRYKGNGFDLNSMTSWQYLHDYMLMDIDYLPADYLHMTERQHGNSIMEELTIRSNNAGRWHWTFGVLGSYQWLKTVAPVYFNDEMNAFLSKTITNYAYTGMLNAMANRMAQGMIAGGMSPEVAQQAAQAQAAAAIASRGGATINMAMSPVPGLFHTPTFNLGLFHESNIEISDKLVATLGLRYDYSHLAIDYLTSARVALQESIMGVNINPVVTSLLSQHEHNSFNQLLPKVGLTYKLNNGSNVYATWSKGYRAGGFNFQMFSDILQTEVSGAANTARADLDIAHDEAFYSNVKKTIAYKPETSWNYEIGTHLNLFDKQVHLDLSAFYMQIRNQQLSVLAGNYGFGRMMTNAGKSHSCGLEARLRGSAFSNALSYGFSYGFTSARFDSYTETTDEGEVNYKDKKVPFVPMHTMAAGADYRIEVDKAALLNPNSSFALRDFTVGVNVAAQGKIYWDEANTSSQKFYAVLGAHAAANFGLLGVNLWVRNLTNTKYNTFAVQSAATGTRYTFAQQGNPFQMGVDLSYHF